MQNGSGGRSAFDEAPLFLAEQCPLKDHKVYLILLYCDMEFLPVHVCDPGRREDAGDREDERGTLQSGQPGEKKDFLTPN